MSYEAPVLSKKHGFGDAKASEASSRLVQARLIQGEKPGMYNAYLSFINSLNHEIFICQ